MAEAIIIGGGLAGSEAAWQLAERGINVRMFEMRPCRSTGAHQSDQLAELVCSNSMGSKSPDRPSGLLQEELRLLGSYLIDCAQRNSLPAGEALAVDRERFAQEVTDAISHHPRIQLVRQEITEIPAGPVIIATGPLTSARLTAKIAETTPHEYLHFYDAIAPIVLYDSIDMRIAFHANRFRQEDDAPGDYVNCPLDESQYDLFVKAVCDAPTSPLRDFEQEDSHFFEGCLPIEQLARRGHNSLAYGPMRPVGLRDPRTGKRPHAVVQLRRDNLAGKLYNMVGFQTNIRWGDQERILRMIPGLERAEFIRMGQMHRNTFINSPALLTNYLSLQANRDLFFAGQITGVEGYAGSIATGLIAGINLACMVLGKPGWIPPRTSMIGVLCYYITNANPGRFQPMKANFGILPEIESEGKSRHERKLALIDRARTDLRKALSACPVRILNSLDHSL